MLTNLNDDTIFAALLQTSGDSRLAANLQRLKETQKSDRKVAFYIEAQKSDIYIQIFIVD